MARDGRMRYVCTENPKELAWFMGIDETAMKKGNKPKDEELLECFEVRGKSGGTRQAG